MNERQLITQAAAENGWMTYTQDELRSEWRKGSRFVFSGFDSAGFVTVAMTDEKRVTGKGRSEKLIEELGR